MARATSVGLCYVRAMSKEPRVAVHMRMALSGTRNIDTLAKEHHLSRSDVIRVMLAVAANHPEQVVRGLTQLAASR